MSGTLSIEERAQLEQLFDQGADLPPDEHAAFVARACDGRPALAAELSRLLAAVSGDDVLTAIQTAGGAVDLTGTRIGPYQLEERVGEGGMGEVWRAHQLEPVTRTVALKLIRRGMDSAQVVARFEAERQALARMSHPHVAQVLGGGSTADGRPYFVMEYVDGEPLTTWCDSHGLSTRERLALFLDVCEGVGHAHQKGLIHRDLKPGNVLVAEQGGRPVAKVIDFGVARATTGRIAQQTLHTLVGQLVGTLDYMSPEQADPGAVDVDTRSDVYSLGVVLYELLSGALPFDHGTVLDRPLSEIQRAIREEDPPTPSTRFKRRTDASADIARRRGVGERELLHELDGDLDVICLHALQKQPERRYASVADMAEDVRRHLAHEPVLARRPSATYRMGKFARRHRVGVSAAAVIVIALLVGAYGIVSGGLAAEAKAVELQRLSDAWRVGPLVAEADQLWPAVPATLPAIEDWLVRARAVVERLDASRGGATAAGVERFEASRGGATAAGVGSGPADVAVGDLPPDLWESLAVLRDGLLAADGTSGERGASVPRRLVRARRLAADHAPGGALHRAWSDALPAIHAAYPGLVLTPQVELLPLGADRRSGLWEFAHLPSGEPARRVDGELVRDDATGLVLVLLPGGTFFMGSQRDDPEGPNFVEGLVPQAQLTESPVRSESVDPFFMSKYEVTRAQWRRLMGIEPLDHEGDMTPACPINFVSWLDSVAFCGRAGLMLPSEVQWEYAARSGTDTPWWTGETADSVRGRANLRESTLSAAALAGLDDQRGTPWLDGFEKLAPVGSFEANLFGLHDVIGNVVEWTASFTAFTEGKTSIVNKYLYRMARGGAYSTPAAWGRAAIRTMSSVPEFKTPNMGFRPARAVVW